MSKIDQALDQLTKTMLELAPATPESHNLALALEPYCINVCNQFDIERPYLAGLNAEAVISSFVSDPDHVMLCQNCALIVEYQDNPNTTFIDSMSPNSKRALIISNFQGYCDNCGDQYMPTTYYIYA